MKTKMKIETKAVWELPRGHRAHRGGAGIHADRRTKRENTRSAKLRKILQEYS
jgi:hypothetical protein